jgi:CSLREA domain-containing protein
LRPFVNSPYPRILLFCITLSVFAILVAQSLVAAPPLVTSELDNIAVDGACTLREAILSANGTPANPDCAAGTNITFDPTILNITINSAAPLPPLTADGITIDGALNLAEIVTLTGAAGAGDGLTIQSANNVIRNLAIVDFPGNGIVIEGVGATGTTLSGLFVGTNIALEPDLGNGSNGIVVRGGAQNNSIGIFPITNLADRNTIGSNTLNGVQFADVDTSNNILTGTIIGVRSDFGGVRRFNCDRRK